MEAELAAREVLPPENDSEAAGNDQAPENGKDIEALRTECETLRDQVLRGRADFDNYRKRMARQAEQMRKTAAEGLIRDLLPVIDHLELALQHADMPGEPLKEGVAMVLTQFQEALSKHGVTPIAALGEPFDPNVHEAVMQRDEGEDSADCVVEEFQKGYFLGEQVLRPSKVVVGLSTDNTQETADEEQAAAHAAGADNAHEQPESVDG